MISIVGYGGAIVVSLIIFSYQFNWWQSILTILLGLIMVGSIAFFWPMDEEEKRKYLILKTMEELKA